MRLSRTVPLLLIVLAVLAVAGAWLLPGALDWNQYRPEIERLATRALGRSVRIGGAITFDLLPEPVLTAGNLQIEDAGDGVARTVRELRLRPALGPLLAGRLHARRVVLQAPVLRVPWPPPDAPQLRPAWLGNVRAEIEEGALQIGGVTLAGINAQFTTNPDTGSLSGAGSATLGGRSWRFTARLAHPGSDGAAGLDATLDGQGALQDTGGRFSGVLAADGALSGEVSGRGRDLSLLVPAPAVAWQASGTLSASAGRLTTDDLSLQLGGSPAHGTVALRVGEGARLDLALNASRLDLGGWLRVLTRAPTNALPIGIALSAEAATLDGGTLRAVRGGFDLASGVTTVRDVSAVLPGEARLALSGQTGPGPGFRGMAQLAAPDLRTTLRWAASVRGLAETLPPDVARVADLSGTVAVSDGQVAFRDLRGMLDGARVDGSIELTGGEQPLLTVNAGVDGLALDAWLPRPDTLAHGYPWPSLSHHFARFDADVTLRARSAEWAGLTLDSLNIEAHFDQRAAQIRRLAASGMGAHLFLSGAVSEEGRIEKGTLDASTKDVAALRDLLPDVDWDGMPLLRGPAEAHLRATGAPNALDLHVDALLADCRINARSRLNVPARSWVGSVSLQHPGVPRLLASLGLPDIAAWLGDGSLSLVAQLAVAPGTVEARDVALTAGALRMDASLAAQLSASGNRVAGQVSAEVLPLPMLKLRSSDPLPLRELRGWDAAIDLRAKQVLVGLVPVLGNVETKVAVEGGTLRLGALKATLDDGTVEGSATLEVAADPPRLTLDGRISGALLDRPLFGTPLDLRSGQVSAEAKLDATGYSPLALLSTLSGEVSALVRDGTVLGFDLAGADAAIASDDAPRWDALARDALQGGMSAFSTLDLGFGLRDGTATLTTARLVGPSGTATASGTADFPGGLLDLRVALRPAEPPGAPELVVSLDGPATAPERTANVFELLRWSLAQPAQ